MYKIVLITTLFLMQIEKSIGQEKPMIFLSGVKGMFIKKSQLLDTSINIITNSPEKISGIIQIYFSGAGFTSVVTTTTMIGCKLMYFRDKLKVGSEITIGGFLYTDKKTQQKIYFEESSYKIVDD